MFGICLGHQLIAPAYGARIGIINPGHRGGNHPRERAAYRPGSDNCSKPRLCRGERLPERHISLEITHINLLDGIVEGCECIEDKVISVQFHPEGTGAAGFNLPFRQIHKHDSSSQQIILPAHHNVLNVFKVFRSLKSLMILTPIL